MVWIRRVRRSPVKLPVVLLGRHAAVAQQPGSIPATSEQSHHAVGEISHARTRIIRGRVQMAGHATNDAASVESSSSSEAQCLRNFRYSIQSLNATQDIQDFCPAADGVNFHPKAARVRHFRMIALPLAGNERFIVLGNAFRDFRDVNWTRRRLQRQDLWHGRVRAGQDHIDRSSRDRGDPMFRSEVNCGSAKSRGVERKRKALSTRAASDW
jgi:hypothetical protein